MKFRYRNTIWKKVFPNLKHIYFGLVKLPCPLNLNYWWNFGSLLGLVLVMQIYTGFILTSHYVSTSEGAFDSIQHIMRDVNKGWLFRYCHMNGASFMFIFAYVHIARGLYYGSYLKHKVWLSGILMLIMMMAIAFLGYVLPWGQMSYWGATVITNFISTIPICGPSITEWIWGGYSVGGPTLERFFALHFILPFLLVAIVGGHLIFLHEEGSSCPLGLETKYTLIPFVPFYAVKDLVGFSAFSFVFSFVVFFHPNMFAEADNFIKANPMVTPEHIVPEWYFLFAYAILRCIPSKGMGVVMLMFSLLVLAVLPWSHLSTNKGMALLPLSQFLFWWFIACFFGLTWVGGRPAEPPYIKFAIKLYHFYFIYLIILHPLVQFWEANEARRNPNVKMTHPIDW